MRFSVVEHLIIPALATAAFAAGCANQIPPSGGPMDEAGPAILACSPAPYTVGFQGDRVEFIFDEYVDQRSFEESVFLSPTIEEIEFEWSGKMVEVIFRSPLRAATTYVLTVGTDVTDLEPARRNRMQESFTLAFSTGEQIDRGFISGRVYPREPTDQVSGIMIMAYHVQGIRPDTLDPTMTRADYVTQSGSDGSFRLPHIRLGPYLVLAIRDEYRNMLYDREVDDFAVLPTSVRLTEIDTARAGIVFQLAREDTSGPRLISIEPKDRNHILIGFSEPIDTSAEHAVHVSIIDTVDRKLTQAFVVVPLIDDHAKAVVVCDYLTPDRPYVMQVTRVRDRSGNAGIDGALARTFTGPSSIDTIGPRLVAVSLRDSTREVDTDISITLTFSEPVLPESAQRVTAQFSTPGMTAIPAMIQWPVMDHAVFSPNIRLSRTTWYDLQIELHGLRDWKEVPIADTTLRLTFATRDEDNDGSVQGHVIDESVTDTVGRVIVSAREIKTRDAKIFTAKAGSGGEFRVGGLPAGRYVIAAYRDRNENGLFDAGAPIPFIAAERRSDLSDTLRVRPRWPLDGLTVRLPR